MKLLSVAAGTLLPEGSVPRRDLPARDPLRSPSSAALCPSQRPFGQGLLPPLPASSPGSLPGALGPAAQKGRRIYLLIRFLHQVFLPDSVFPERVFFPPDCWLGRAGRAPCSEVAAPCLSLRPGQSCPTEESRRPPVVPGIQGCFVTLRSSSSGPPTNGDNQNGPDTGTGASTAAVLCHVNFASPL